MLMQGDDKNIMSVAKLMRIETELEKIHIIEVVS